MRRAVALLGCLALLVAFDLAPFQHVHRGHDDHDHEHSSLIHAHFYTVAYQAPEHQDEGPEIEDAHDPHTASPLDTYTVIPAAVFAIALPAQLTIAAAPPAVLSAQVDAIEERAHDPPAFRPSIPRAPPI